MSKKLFRIYRNLHKKCYSVSYNGGVSAKPLGDFATPPDGYMYHTQGWITYNPRQHSTWVGCYTKTPCPSDAIYVVDLSWMLLRPALFAVRKIKEEL